MEPRIDGKPNPDKKMWGDTQMEWLKNSLRTSTSVFKIIVTGSQTLNAASPWDCLQNYPIEFNNLMNFLTEEKINGVLFITGDRHHSEINKWDRSGTYSLYDITSSALTSSVGKVTGNEVNNPGRLPNTLVEQNNYARITVSGAQRARNLKVEFVGVKGDLLASWSVKESELRTP
jgi:alkaline phosphatase D